MHGVDASEAPKACAPEAPHESRLTEVGNTLRYTGPDWPRLHLL